LLSTFKNRIILNHELTKDKITGEAQHHLLCTIRLVNTPHNIYGDHSITVLRLPSGLQRAAPTNTPGSAIVPKRSCHSAVFLISALLMTLEIIVAEKTPFGNVTCGDDDQASAYIRRVKGAHEIIQKPVGLLNNCIH
jgi:hypothetical protein